MDPEKEAWLRRQVQGLKDGITESVLKIRLERKYLQQNMEERRMILKMLREGK